MRAVTFQQPGPPSVLEVVELPDLEPGPDDLLVRNFAAALNRADILQRRGLYPPPPGESAILGLEFAGEVARCGSRASGFVTGDRIFGLAPGGGYAEQVVIDHRLVLRIPDRLSFDAAAAVPEVFSTALESLVVLGGLAEGSRVLIHAAGSGVGTAAIQLASRLGAEVWAAGRTAWKLERCRGLGARRTIVAGEEDFAEVVLAETGGDGVDIILDLMGARCWEPNLRCLRAGGRILLVGLLGGARVEVDLWHLLRRRIHVIGNILRGRSFEERLGIIARLRERVLPLLESGEIRPVLDSVYALEDVREAHARMDANLNCGKIVLRF